MHLLFITSIQVCLHVQEQNGIRPDDFFRHQITPSVAERSKKQYVFAQNDVLMYDRTALWSEVNPVLSQN